MLKVRNDNQVVLVNVEQRFDVGNGPSVYPPLGPYPTISADFTKLTNATTPAWIDNSGTTGNRMITDSTGVVTYAPANMLLRSEDFSATWTLTNVTQTGGQTDPNSGSNATTLTASAANGTVKQAVTTLARTYIYSVWLKRKTGTGNIDITAGGTTWVTQSITSSWARYSVVQTGVAGTSNPGIRIVTNGDAVDAFGAQLESVTYQTSPGTYIKTTTAAIYQLRYDYNGAVSPATGKGILLEESRANLCTYSETTSDASWTATSVTKTSTNNADPFGTSTALLASATSPTTAHFIGAGSLSYTSGTSYTASIYVKAGTASLVQFTFNTSAFGSGQYANYSLSGSGSVTASSGGTASITRVSSSWYRISFTASATATVSAGGGVLAFISSGTDARLPSIAGPLTLYVVGWQVETGAFPTSYISTTSSSVTRVADIVKWTSAAITSYWNATTGSYLAEATKLSTASSSLVAASDGTTANQITTSASTTFSGTITASSATSMSQSAGTVSANTPYRGGLAYASNNMNIAIDNALGTLDTSGSIPTISQVGLGYDAASTRWLNGWMRSFAYYNQRLPEAILKQKSKVGTVY